MAAGRLGAATVSALVVAVLAVSSSAPLIAFAAAPALAIAFWRTALATAALTPAALGRRRAELRAAARGDRRAAGRAAVLAGVALAAHFATWMPSVQLGSVATATALVATQPVWQGLIALAQGRRPPPAGWLGIGLAVAGIAWATGADLGVSTRAVVADLLALLGALAAAAYTALGERARTGLSTTGYTWVCYGVCAGLLGAGCLAAGVPLHGYDTRTWLAVLAVVAGAQLLGHSMFNYALHRVPATTVSVLILLEVPGAALLAWAWLGQTPRAGALPGLVLVFVGVAVVVLAGRTRPAAPDPAVPPSPPEPAPVVPSPAVPAPPVGAAGGGAAGAAGVERGRATASEPRPPAATVNPDPPAGSWRTDGCAAPGAEPSHAAPGDGPAGAAAPGGAAPGAETGGVSGGDVAGAPPPALAAAIALIGRRGPADFPDSYAGLELDAAQRTAVVYRVPSAAFDDFVRRDAADACVEVRDAAHPARELAAWHDRVVADLAGWAERGVPIVTVGARHDGSGVEVGTTDPARVRAELTGRYGPDAPLIVVGRDPVRLLR